jgi:hypothetical protein
MNIDIYESDREPGVSNARENDVIIFLVVGETKIVKGEIEALH